MTAPVLMIDPPQKNALDAGFSAAFGDEPTPLPAVQKSAATTATISVAYLHSSCRQDLP